MKYKVWLATLTASLSIFFATATYGATFTYDPSNPIILNYPPNTFFGSTLTIDKDTDFSPGFETSGGNFFNFTVAHNGNDGDPADPVDWGFEFYADGMVLASTHHFSPSPSSGPYIFDTFGPFNLSDENWKFVIQDLTPNPGGLFVDSVSLSNVPIPGAVWLLLSGLAGLVCLGRKINK